MANPIRGVRTYIRSKLVANATLNTLVGGRIYTGRAPQGTTSPYVVASLLSSPDRNVMGNVGPVLMTPLYFIRGITETQSLTVLDQIADLIDQTLIGSSGTIAADGIYISGVKRENGRDQETPIPNTSIIVMQLGGEYRFYVEFT